MRDYQMDVELTGWTIERKMASGKWVEYDERYRNQDEDKANVDLAIIVSEYDEDEQFRVVETEWEETVWASEWWDYEED